MKTKARTQAIVLRRRGDLIIDRNLMFYYRMGVKVQVTSIHPEAKEGS